MHGAKTYGLAICKEKITFTFVGAFIILVILRGFLAVFGVAELLEAESPTDTSLDILHSSFRTSNLAFLPATS